MQGVVHVNTIMSNGSTKRIPAFGLDLFTRAGAAIVFGCHLGEQAVAQAERGSAETRGVDGGRVIRCKLRLRLR